MCTHSISQTAAGVAETSQVPQSFPESISEMHFSVTLIRKLLVNSKRVFRIGLFSWWDAECDRIRIIKTR